MAQADICHLHRLFCSARAAEHAAEDGDNEALKVRTVKRAKKTAARLLAARPASLADLRCQASVLTWIYQHDEGGPNILETHGDVVEVVAIRSVLGGLLDLMPQTKDMEEAVGLGGDGPSSSRVAIVMGALGLAGRDLIEHTIEELISFLDDLDDSDQEPECEDEGAACEGEGESDDREPDVDDEPSLGSTGGPLGCEYRDQRQWADGSTDDREDDGDDLEPDDSGIGDADGLDEQIHYLDGAGRYLPRSPADQRAAADTRAALRRLDRHEMVRDRLDVYGFGKRLQALPEGALPRVSRRKGKTI